MSLQVTLDIRGLVAAETALSRLAPLQEAELMEGLARLLQQQTRRRIEEEKTSPDGTPWKPNLRRGSILHLSGALSNSIDYLVQGLRAIVGSGLVYARIQQEGGTIVPKQANALAFRIGNQMIYAKSVTLPARPFIGVSADNSVELMDVAVAFLRKRIGL